MKPTKSAPARRQTTWGELAMQLLPFADVVTDKLPLSRLMRLSLFQVSVGMAFVLLNGTLNRVMLVEMHVPAWLVATMISLPLLFAPLRVLIGHKSDGHKSVLGWRRVPYIWFGSLMQFAGFAIMPFALILLSPDFSDAPRWIGHASAALAFLLVGLGMHTTQTAGLALATDIAPEASRPQVVALLYVSLLLSMVVSSIFFGWFLSDFNTLLLIQAVQGAAVATMVFNFASLWKQEVRNKSMTAPERPRVPFRESWQAFMQGGQASRLLVLVGLGTAGFTMQDILLEPYGGQILHLSVSATTLLTAMFAGGSLVGFTLSALVLSRGFDPVRLATAGLFVGVVAFSTVVSAGALDSALLFRLGTVLIGFGSGLFAVGTLTTAMGLAQAGFSGLALGAWGSVQATASGVAVAMGGGIYDVVADLATSGALGPALNGPIAGYMTVYCIEIVLLIMTLVAVIPLLRRRSGAVTQETSKFGLAEFPG